MSRENVDLVKAGYDALNRRDLSAMLEFLDPDGVFNSVVGPLEGGDAFRGPEGAREYLAAISEAFVDITWEVERITDVDDEHVIAYVRGRGRGTTSGAGFDQRSFAVIKFRGGKVLRIDSYPDEAQALEAVGLRE
jgi:ketosteroid isomerase-like protein